MEVHFRQHSSTMRTFLDSFFLQHLWTVFATEMTRLYVKTSDVFGRFVAVPVAKFMSCFGTTYLFFVLLAKECAKTFRNVRVDKQERKNKMIREMIGKEGDDQMEDEGCVFDDTGSDVSDHEEEPVSKFKQRIRLDNS